MQPVKSLLAYFSFSERLLWSCSVLFILVSFWLFGGQGWLTLTASLIGATSLLFIAKGNPVGQLLTVVFSLLYGYISLTFRYYGEMITYLGMTAPMAVAALVSWLRHPYKGDRAQVQVNRLAAKEPGLLALLTAAVTGVFYFILAAFGAPICCPVPCRWPPALRRSISPAGAAPGMLWPMPPTTWCWSVCGCWRPWKTPAISRWWSAL